MNAVTFACICLEALLAGTALLLAPELAPAAARLRRCLAALARAARLAARRRPRLRSRGTHAGSGLPWEDAVPVWEDGTPIAPSRPDAFAMFASACARAGIAHPEFTPAPAGGITVRSAPWEAAARPELVAPTMYRTGPMPALPAAEETIEGRVIAS